MKKAIVMIMVLGSTFSMQAFASFSLCQSVAEEAAIQKTSVDTEDCTASSKEVAANEFIVDVSCPDAKSSYEVKTKPTQAHGHQNCEAVSVGRLMKTN